MSINSNRPTFVAYVITERTGKKNIWTPVGAAWANKDGKGFSIQLHATPIDGKLHLREPLPQRDQEDQYEQNSRIDYDRASRATDGEDIPF